jgi:hypothetical protein
MNSTETDSGTTRLADFFTMLELPLANIDAYSNAYEQLRTGIINGIMLTNVLEEDILAGIVDRLEKHEPAFLKTWFPEEFNSWFYGRNLNLSHPDLLGYFEEAELFNRQLDDLFPDNEGFISHITKILAKLDGGRKFLAAPGIEVEDNYMFATLRCHLEGGYIPPHIDYEYMRRRSAMCLLSYHLKKVEHWIYMTIVLKLQIQPAPMKSARTTI